MPTPGKLPIDPEVKEKFTEKLRLDPREFSAHAVEEVLRIGERLILKPFSKFARFARPVSRAEEGFRAVVDRGPQAEALAASWIVRVRPFLLQVYALRRRLATLAVILLTLSLFVHVMFGANGMVVYKQKRAEYQSLKKQIDQVQQENDRYTRQIQGLKSDQKSIEKEAREQLGYAKAGEYVYVPPAQPKPAPVENRSAKK